MDLYLCEDSEELYRKYDIVGPENTTHVPSLVGIVEIYKLAIAGRRKDVLESARYRECADRGLCGACVGGHEELVLLIIQMVESSGGTVNFNWGLSGACWVGHNELALMMIEKGATEYYKSLEKH
jgi:hypothetical protein